jgi:hypothetical protein
VSMETEGEDKNENPLAAAGGGFAGSCSTTSVDSASSLEGEGIKKLNPDEATGADVSAVDGSGKVAALEGADIMKENPLLVAGAGAASAGAGAEVMNEKDDAAVAEEAGADTSEVVTAAFKNPKALKLDASTGRAVEAFSSVPSFFALISKPPNIVSI